MALKRSSIVKAVNSAFKALGEVPENFTYRRSSSVYNPATGTNIVTNTDYNIQRGFFLGYDASAIDKVLILASDIRLIFQQSELSISPVIATDRVVRTSDGKVFNIIRTSQDPVRSLHILQLRSPS